jgi:hypothetical protein
VEVESNMAPPDSIQFKNLIVNYNAMPGSDGINSETFLSSTVHNRSLKHELLKQVLRERSQSTNSRLWKATDYDDSCTRARSDSINGFYDVPLARDHITENPDRGTAKSERKENVRAFILIK